MAVAMMYPEARRGRHSELNNLTGVTNAYVSNARTVLKYAPEYTDSVIAGAKSLSEAYEEARQRKNAGNDDTEMVDGRG